MDVGLLSYRACAYVYVICMSVRRVCCCHILDVDSTVQQWLQRRPENWILLSNSTKNSWNIYKFASYLWFKKSHNNREAVLNRSTSYSTVYNCNWNFSQTEGGCIKWHDKRFSFDSPPICSWKPESRQTSHNSFWYKPPGNTSLKWNN